MSVENSANEIDTNTKYKDGVNKNARLIFRNVSFKATEDDLKKHFAPYGSVEEVKLLRRPDGKLVGCGFVHFTHVPMANEALHATNKKLFLGRPLSVAWAVDKNKYSESLQTDNNKVKYGGSAAKKEKNEIKVEDSQDEEKVKKGDKSKVRVNRNARLIIRNVSFKATEQSLKEHFQPYGEVLEVNLLKKPDGKLVGCAFALFKNVPMAKKALLNTNMKPFLGRPISVDWAVAKNKYMQHSINQQLELEDDVKKEEPESDEDGPTPDESMDDVKEEIKSESDSDEDIKSEVDSDEDEESENESDEPSDDENSEGDDDEEDENDKDIEIETQPEKKRIQLHDAEDGCTVFITNIPFIVDNDQLKEFAEQTGPVKYALICMDKLTEHSKGSGFVKFSTKEDADKFLSLPLTELKLEGQTLQVKPALKRENLQKSDKKEAKDNRNLYLVKEGVVVAGTKAAVGVSASDMAKRLTLERSKTQMLKNLNRFVSRYRIVVSNLPANYDDAALRRACVAAAGKNAVITEARVMRDLRAPPAVNGKHPSKGYGFVMFTRHEDAIACLRKLNNNPDTFDKNNRPIVSFSIEDRTALNARKKRLEKSVANNPLAKRDDGDDDKRKGRKRKRNAPPDESYVKKGRFENNNNKNSVKPSPVGKFVSRPADDEEVGDYTGLTSKQGSQHKMRTGHKLKTQAELHRQNVKLEKKKGKKAMKFKMAAKERVKQPKQQINKNKTGGKKRRFKRDKSVF